MSTGTTKAHTPNQTTNPIHKVGMSSAIGGHKAQTGKTETRTKTEGAETPPHTTQTNEDKTHETDES